MRTLSGKLMELITVGETNLDWQQEDMQKLFLEIGTSLKVITEKRKMELVCESEPGTLRADRELMKSLLYNLVDNAVKASVEGGCIQVTGRFVGEQFQIRVSDQGVGIPQEEIEKITQAFYMVDKSRARSRNGAGLGLALCTEILSLHDSVLEIESTQGKGTRISFVLQNRDKEAEHEEIDD